MRDPFFAQLMFLIEKTICAADQDARQQGVTLKDSQIQSAINKAIGLASGKSPRMEETSEADRILRKLILSINHTINNKLEARIVDGKQQEEKPIRPAEWIMALESVMDSIKTRRSGIPGSRDYLDFVQGFILRAAKQYQG